MSKQTANPQEFEAAIRAFNRLSSVGQFEALRYSYFAIDKSPAADAPLPPALRAIEGACNILEDSFTGAPMHPRFSFAACLDFGTLARRKDAADAFEQTASTLPAGHVRANYAAFALMMFSTTSGGRSGITKAKLAATERRVALVEPAALNIIKGSFSQLAPHARLSELEKSGMLLDMARVNNGINALVTRLVDDGAGARGTAAAAKRLRAKITPFA